MTLTSHQLSALGKCCEENGNIKCYIDKIQMLFVKKLPEGLRVYVDPFEEIYVENCNDKELEDEIKNTLQEVVSLAADCFVVQYHSPFGKEILVADDLFSAELFAREIWESYPKTRRHRMKPVVIFEPNSETPCMVYPGKYSVEIFTREEYTRNETTHNRYFDDQDEALVYGLKLFRDMNSEKKYYVHIKEKDLVIKAYAPGVPE